LRRNNFYNNISPPGLLLKVKTLKGCNYYSNRQYQTIGLSI
jgi:hypothetical protein